MEILAVFFVFCGIAAWGYYRNANRRLKKQLREAPPCRIGALDEGEHGKIIGHARVHEQRLTAPLTGRECVYYSAKVESSDGDDGWVVKIEEERGVPFVLDDGSGRAIVDPRGADLAIGVDYETTTGVFIEPDELQQKFLDRFDYRGRGLIFRRHLRYREAVIEVGERVAVLGGGIREPDPTRAPGGYRDSQPTLLRLASTGDHSLVISDDPSTTE